MDTTALTAIEGNGEELAGRLTLAEMEGRFISFLAAKTPATLATYKSAIRHLLQYLAGKGISAPTRQDMIEYSCFLQSQYKARTVNLYLTGARIFFQWTADEGLYKNIMVRVDGVKVKREFVRGWFTAGQVCDILDTAEGEDLGALRDKAILSLMVCTGLRCVSIIRANVGDMQTMGGCIVLYYQGKGDTEKNKWVKVEADVERAIRAYLKARGTVADDAPLFASNSNRNGGERLTTRSVSRLVKGHFIQAGFNSAKLTAHSLRHTAAVTNILNGGSMEETQSLCGHSSIDMTANYSHNIQRIKNNSEARIWAAYMSARKA